MKKVNPIAAMVQPLAGKQLSPDWKKTTDEFGGTFDRRDLSSMWMNPNWSAKLNGDNVENILRNSRLSSTTASGI